MKRFTILLVTVALLFTSGLANGQDASQVSEHLKPYGPMLGTWRYEGPLQEDVAGIAEKGSKLMFQFSWRRILDKNVVMEDWLAEFENGKSFSGKALIGWNATDKEIAYGGMDSAGGMSLGKVVFDKQARTSTLTGKGVDAEGNETSFKTVVKKTGKDTLTWKAIERIGGIAEGPTNEYTFQRVKRAAGKKAAK
jgi:hypothetical protein